MRTEEDDRERLLEVSQAHVSEQHGQEYSLDEIDERYVDVVEVEIGAES